MSKTTLLLDGDIFAYRASLATEQKIDWGGGVQSHLDDFDGAISVFESAVARTCKALGSKEIIVCLTDGVNWRKEVMPSYKANRLDVPKPLVLAKLKEYITDNYNTYLRPTLEADDIMGILATHPSLVAGDKIIVSADKDLRTIPAKHWYQSKLRTHSVKQADYWFMYQTLIGDTTDNYPGCRMIGPKKAHAILNEVPKSLPDDLYAVALWEAVLATFLARGQTEADALANARVARICRAEDYDFTKKEVKLWMPPNQTYPD